jgi:hypothetical protein
MAKAGLDIALPGVEGDEKVRFWIAVVLGVSVFTVATLAQADAGAQSTASTAEAKSLLDNVYASYFGVYHGAPLSDLGNARTVDSQGKLSKSQSIYFDSELTTAYMVTPDIGVGPVVPFFITPVRGEGLTLGDVGVKAFNKRTYSANGLSVYTNLILQAPTSSYSSQRGMTLGVKTTPNLRYNVPASRFTFGAWTEAKSYLGVTSGKAFKLYAAPYANYRLTSNLSLNLEYEMEADHMVGKPSFDFTSYQTDLEPGVVWNITQHISVNPYLMLFTGNTINSDTMAFGAVINARLL